MPGPTLASKMIYTLFDDSLFRLYRALPLTLRLYTVPPCCNNDMLLILGIPALVCDLFCAQLKMLAQVSIIGPNS